jgi:hypothetical protein
MTSKAVPGRGAIIRGLVISVVINGVLPFLIYGFLSAGIGSVPALLLAALPPIIDSVVSLIRRGHLDTLGTIIFSGLVLSVIVALWGGNGRILLARESLVTGLIGLGFLASLFLARPVQFYIARHFATGNDPLRVVEWSELWKKYPRFRHGMRIMTFGWGTGLVVEAVLRIGLALTLPISTFLALSPFIQYSFYFSLMGWSMWYGRQMQRKGEEARLQPIVANTGDVVLAEAE